MNDHKSVVMHTKLTAKKNTPDFSGVFKTKGIISVGF